MKMFRDEVHFLLLFSVFLAGTLLSKDFWATKPVLNVTQTDPCPSTCQPLYAQCNSMCQCDPKFCDCCISCLKCLGANWTDCAGCWVCKLFRKAFVKINQRNCEINSHKYSITRIFTQVFGRIRIYYHCDNLMNVCHTDHHIQNCN